MPRHPGRFPTAIDGLYYHAFRTTDRDRWLLAALYEHQILTTEQITELAFGAPRTARRRLAELTGLRLIERTRSNPAGPGTSSYLYTLAPAGALMLSGQRDMDLKQLRYDRARTQRQALRPDLRHSLGCNTLMIHLATAHRTSATGHLATWLGALSCLRRWGDQIRPDAYGYWFEQTGHTAGCGFFLEYDTGTESLTQLAAKVHGYTRFARNHIGHHPILIHTSTPSREAKLHALLTETHGTCPVPIATATDPNPHAPTWLPHTATDRTSITRLPGLFTALGYRILPPIAPGPDTPAPAWDTPGAGRERPQP
jgi:Replication-relaxation